MRASNFTIPTTPTLRPKLRKVARLLGSGPEHDAARLRALLYRVLEQADRLEQDYLPGHDWPLEFFLDDIEKDIVNAR